MIIKKVNQTSTMTMPMTLQKSNQTPRLNTGCDLDLVPVFLPDNTTNMVGLGTYYQAGNAVACLQHSSLSFHTQKEHAFRKQSLLMKRLADPRNSLEMDRTLKSSLTLTLSFPYTYPKTKYILNFI